MIVDDHAIVRSGLSRLLESQSQFQVIETLDSAEALLVKCKTQVPDLVITDLSMPGMGGIELVKRLLLKWPKLKVVIFSIYQNPYLVNRVIELGAKGYISKSSETQVILDGLKAIIRGDVFISSDINMQTELSGSMNKLSAREFDIFKCISEGLGTKQASEKLFLSEKTIANNISIIKRKLNISCSTEMVHIALAEGLFIAEES